MAASDDAAPAQAVQRCHDDEPLGRELFVILGERWNYLIMREVFFGTFRFGQLQRALTIAPNVLTSRLAGLVDLNLLERHQYRSDKPWYEYRLTQDARAVMPGWIAMSRWATAHLGPREGDDLRALRHRTCGQITTPFLTCDACGEQIEPDDLQPDRS